MNCDIVKGIKKETGIDAGLFCVNCQRWNSL